jgi:cholesterol oxidase
MDQFAYDFVVIGSGFGGSVSALRLAEKGYSVLVLEQGKRFEDHDFPQTNWALSKYLWAPRWRCFGLLEMSFFRGVLVLHGAGLGGGSLGYAGVLVEPHDDLYRAEGWGELRDWRSVLAPHFTSVRQMLGVEKYPGTTPADDAFRRMAASRARRDTFRPTDVAVFFGEEGVEVPDPYFGGKGPSRSGCVQCGGCMVGCRYNAKNTLTKNYLYLAERLGVQVSPERRATNIRQIHSEGSAARYEVVHQASTAWLGGDTQVVRARNVVVSAGVLGTLELLLRCRDVTRSLPQLSRRLGTKVRTNSEALLGVSSGVSDLDFSYGVSITSGFQADDETYVEPVRYSSGSSFMRLLGAPLIASGHGLPGRVLRTVWGIVSSPLEFLRSKLGSGWAERTTILLVMQKKDNLMQLVLRRRWWRALRYGLAIHHDDERRIPAELSVGHALAREFASEVDGYPQTSFVESILGMPVTAHILGGCPMGKSADDGVIDADGRVFNYDGLFVVDGSMMPANPGINPSLTIAALAEHAMSAIPEKAGRSHI